MILAYLDESGNTGKDLITDENQPFHWVAAVLIGQAQWHDSKNAVEDIRQFAHDNGFSGYTCELHGKEILHGKKPWRAMPLDVRLKILEMSISVLTNFDIKMVVGGCNKTLLAKKKYSRPEHPHSIATWLCLERVAQYVRGKRELAVLVADECSREHKEFSRTALESYRINGAPFGPTLDLSCLLDTIHFMSSVNSPHIQLCDIALYVWQRYRITKDSRLEGLFYAVSNRFVSSAGVIPY